MKREGERRLKVKKDRKNLVARRVREEKKKKKETNKKETEEKKETDEKLSETNIVRVSRLVSLRVASYFSILNPMISFRHVPSHHPL